MTIGEAAAASVGPSNYRTKINNAKLVVAFGGHKSTIAHNNNQPTKLMWARRGRDISGCGTGGEWMGGRNNQTIVDRNDGIYFWETACRAMTIVEAAAASFGPSNYRTKINNAKLVAAFGGHKSTIAHNNNNQPN